jgi:hypothetical protein
MIAANVSSVTPVSEYRGDVYTQSVKLTLSNGTTVTVFDGVASLSAGVKIERVRLAGQAVEVEIELASTLTETPETAQLRVGSDVSVVVNRLDLDDYDHVTDEK